MVGVEDGELFLEWLCFEVLVFDDGCVKIVSYDVIEGFGLCVVNGEVVGYVYFLEIFEFVLKCVVVIVWLVVGKGGGVLVVGFFVIN